MRAVKAKELRGLAYIFGKRIDIRVKQSKKAINGLPPSNQLVGNDVRTFKRDTVRAERAAKGPAPASAKPAFRKVRWGRELER